MEMKSKDTSKSDWLTPVLQSDIRAIFGSRYKRQISLQEAINIADSLTYCIETIIKSHINRKMEDKDE